MSTAYKYQIFWKNHLPLILEKIQEANATHKAQGITLNREEFEAIGNRSNSGYGFRMDIVNGVIPTKSGTSVARDLKYVLDRSVKFMELAENRTLTIRMGKDFILEIIPQF